MANDQGNEAGDRDGLARARQRTGQPRQAGPGLRVAEPRLQRARDLPHQEARIFAAADLIAVRIRK